MKQRVRILASLEVDLDLVPGPYHQSSDWVNLVKSQLEIGKSYNPDVKIIEVEVINEVCR